MKQHNNNTFAAKVFAAAMMLLAGGQAKAQCITGDCDNGYGVYIYDSGTRHDGFWKKGEENGFGAKIMSNGDTYIGNFKDGYYSGEGMYIWAQNGSKYIGHWEKGDRQGIGRYIDENGESTTNIWNQDEILDEDEKVTGCINGDCKSGYGVAIYNDGSYYEGEWKNGYPNGQGKLYLANGGTYEGEFKKGRYNQYGILTRPNGSQKEGMWDMGSFIGEVNRNAMSGCISGNCENGYGIYVYDYGFYKGEWQNGKQHGRGIMVGNNGVVVEGTFEDDHSTGFAEIKYEDDNVLKAYVGDVQNDGPHGYGALFWKDGSLYWGQLKNSQINGLGVYVDVNGTKQSGLWQNGNFIKSVDENEFPLIYGEKNGFGIRLTQWGRYSGQLVNGLPNGMGSLRWYDGRVSVGNFFKDGSVIGEGLTEWPNGDRYVGSHYWGMANGKGTLYLADGTVVEGNWENGQYLENRPVVNNTVARPEVSWTTPQYYNTESTESKTTIKLCVTSKAAIQEVTISVNGETVVKTAPKHLKMGSNNCDYSLEYEIDLQPGRNEIMAEVRNEGGVTKSDSRYITLKKNENLSEEKRVALVIGNSAYQSIPALPNPVNDAKLMAKTLSGLGFEVMLGTDMSQNEMKQIIRDFGDKLADTKAVGLFFYAGHGLQVGGENYLVPVTANISKEQEVEYECVTLGRLIGQMESAQNELNIIILDACRNNPFAKTRAVKDGGLAQVNAPRGTFIAFSTAPGKTASDGLGSNGLYTEQLVKHISTPGMRIEDVFKGTRNDVYKESNQEQLPWENSSIFGDFFFKK